MRVSPLLAALPFALASFATAVLAQSTLPPTPAVKLALNPATNKVYLADTAANAVTAFDASTGTSKSIAVGGAPTFIAVNPATNRVYVENDRDATLSEIDGATDALIATYQVNATGPITINPLTNVVYIVRLTGTGSDEVTFFNANNAAIHTIATSSFQPNAMAVDPATDTIYVTHYASGDVRVISGVFDPQNDFPASTSIGVFSHPYAIAANPATKKVFVITQDARGPIAIIDGANNTAAFPAILAGHAQGPQSIAVNPVSNKAYAAFANEVIVIDGSTQALTYIPISGAGSGAIALGINCTTNRIYAATALGTLTVIDGDTDTVLATDSIPAGTSSVAVNPVTGSAFFFDSTLVVRPASPADTAHPVPLTTAITPLPGDTTPPSGTITMSATNGFSPVALPVRTVYYQIDSTAGPWAAASGSGPFTASFSGLGAGSHTLHAFAVDGQDATLATGPQSMPLVGSMAEYTFNVAVSKADPSLSLASSANPSTAGQTVTFTASVSGSAGTPSGSVTFRDGTATLCTGTTLATGAASCASSSLAAGTHSIVADYSGDASYNPASSPTLTQAVSDPNAPPPTDLALSQSISPNPAMTGRDVAITLVVSNNGPTGASNIALADSLPAGWTFVWASAGCAGSGGAVDCAASSLAAGASVQFTIVARPASAGSAANDASVSASEPDPAPSNNASAASIAVNASPAANQVLRYRLYSPVTQEHLFTTDKNEYDTLGASGSWNPEGTVGHVLDDPGSFNGVDAVPYYRLYNTGTRWHHWTTDPNEYYTLIRFPGWNGEGVDGFILPTAAPGATPLYRLLYPDGRGLHHWTIDPNEYDTLTTTYGWIGEGGTGYVMP